LTSRHLTDPRKKSCKQGPRLANNTRKKMARRGDKKKITGESRPGGIPKTAEFHDRKYARRRRVFFKPATG